MIEDTASLVRKNVANGDVVVVRHARAQLRARGLDLECVISGASTGEAIENYPHDDAGPAVLFLQQDAERAPIHVLWRIEAATAGPVCLVTAYRPDPAKWSADFRVRRSAPTS